MTVEGALFARNKDNYLSHDYSIDAVRTPMDLALYCKINSENYFETLNWKKNQGVLCSDLNKKMSTVGFSSCSHKKITVNR